MWHYCVRRQVQFWKCLRNLVLWIIVIYLVSFSAVFVSTLKNNPASAFVPALKNTTVSLPLRNTSLQLVITTPVPYTITQEPIIVLILTYQRSGSSFLGQIFNQNPEAFYVFEPLDGLYTAMYGTSEGYNAPSDITQYWNGTIRVLPEDEVKSQAKMMSDLLGCEHSELPTEVITNVFWVGFKGDQQAASDYSQCLRNKKVVYNTCTSKVRKHCKIWFGEPGSRQKMCHLELWNHTVPNPRPVLKEFKAFRQCNIVRYERARTCFPHLSRACTSAHIRSAKVVRMTMRAVEPMLQLYHHRLKVIHLVRDPRAVVLSRQKYESVRGHYAGSNKKTEAVTVCRTLLEDLKIRHRLEKTYPNSFIEVIYDEFIRNPVRHTESIYAKLGKYLPGSVRDYLKQHTSLNNTRPLDMDDNVISEIDTVCEEMYKELGYRW